MQNIYGIIRKRATEVNMGRVITIIFLLLFIIFLILYAIYVEDLIRMDRVYSYFGGYDPPEFQIFIARVVCIIMAVIFSIGLILYIFQ